MLAAEHAADTAQQQSIEAMREEIRALRETNAEILERLRGKDKHPEA
jgi:hypothetical protein